MSAETSMTDEVKTVAEKILSWVQILMTELHSMKSHTEENMQNMKACTNLLYIFVVNWDNLTSATSVGTAISTSAVTTSPSSQESVNCMNSLILKQLVAAIGMSWHSKRCLSNSLRFEEKRVEFKPWLQQIVTKLNVNMSDNNFSVQFWYLHSQLEGLALSQVTSWIAACIKPNEVLNHMIIEELINQLQHMYNDSELKKKATCTLKTLKQMKKPFARHLTTFEQTLLKAEGLKWDDAVKKTFLNNSLDTTLTQALIVTSISVLYDEYITLLQWVSHNLNSIQKAVTQECCMTTIIITQQSHTNNINWELTEHIIVAVTETEERHRAQWVSEKKVTEHHMKQLCMHCKDNGHFIKNCKLLSAVQPCVINVAAAETVKKATEEEKNLKKE